MLVEKVGTLLEEYEADIDFWIDNMVYKIYGLTDEEISIVEEAIK